jgi:3-deoxy-manno-octulosonate cytidylyltransferase (CMP-KDO synthetase)
MFVGIIPARFLSTRFPGKPLAVIDGKSMIQRVYEQLLSAGLFQEIFVATDDQRIADHVASFGAIGVLTSPTHLSGTSRCAEVAKNFLPHTIIFNVQGDEPFIQPSQLIQLSRVFENPEVQIATLIKKISTAEELHNPNIVKAVVGSTAKALYFSRQAIPYCRDTEPGRWVENNTFYRHIGMYAYRADVLQKIAALPPSPLSLAENLEQLCWLENGFQIYTGITHIESIGIDTPEDLYRAVSLLKNNEL